MSSCQKTETSGRQCQQTLPPEKKGAVDEGARGDNEAVWGAVQEYYGQKLQRKEDVQTGVNCSDELCAMPEHLRQVFQEIHSDVTDKYYGCGNVIPEAVGGCSVLDLGCGTGRDCFAVSKLVGAEGKVVGVDMTEEQLAVARKYVDYHRDKFGYSQSNVEFIRGQIEKLCEAGLKDNTFDIEISNGVFNLCPEKAAVFKEAFRVLKEGGELYFSDVYTDTHLTPEIRRNPELWGQCVAGALHWEDLYSLAQHIGFSQPRLVAATPVNTSKFSHILGEARFVSSQYRMFKLPSVHSAPAIVTYKGGILGSEDRLTLDNATSFKKDESLAVDGEVATILSSSRFRSFFSFDQAGPVTPVTASPKVDPFQVAASSKSQCCS